MTDPPKVFTFKSSNLQATKKNKRTINLITVMNLTRRGWNAPLADKCQVPKHHRCSQHTIPPARQESKTLCHFIDLHFPSACSLLQSHNTCNQEYQESNKSYKALITPIEGNDQKLIKTIANHIRS